MNIIHQPSDLREILKRVKQEGKTVGFVPTMGYFHEGHLSLIHKAHEKTDFVVVSLFVNPTQFGPREDFNTYPRDLERDQSLAAEHGADVLFIPSSEDMYPDGEAVMVHVNERADVLCGKSRPGHFNGVATVLMKFFNIIGPDYVFFGMKDAQQVAVIDQLINNFHIPVTLVACPTVREKDGLAKSSRNVRLSSIERRDAQNIYKALNAGEQAAKTGEYSPDKIQHIIHRTLLNELTYGELEYVNVLSFPSLTTADRDTPTIIIAVAVRYEKARLIDNVIVTINTHNTKEADIFVTNGSDK